MKPYRSMLFVPGHKSSWAEKGVAAGADALILDLEDAVPAADKAEARSLVRETIGRLGGEDTRADLWVRPNSFDSGLFGADVEAVVVAGLAGLVLPKVFSAQEIVRIDAIVSHIEEREKLAPGSVGLIITYETAESMARCEEIAAASPRIASLLGGTGPNADVGRSLGFEFTVEGLESLYVRSRIILAARSSGLHHPLTGVWQDLKDLEGFRRFAEDSRRLGYRGMMCIHPSHVAPSNEIFTPSAETVSFYRRMVEAFRKAEADGHGAVDFEGMHIDLAHARTAEGIIELADAIGA
ncbi:CoA ester lyase [Amycolatopsis sp. K13G38]|uniref:CoA ester lyase n=1 Tax=Amycolatopsis acididurans TaxID=2724524 RepID=A0ABX1J732_9PSEU|nr:CoA ester lyase [Amycolatopsis acididurans]NKQ55553.1 CoA ester lyase [Amycolatopsis acididurans]